MVNAARGRGVVGLLAVTMPTPDPSLSAGWQYAGQAAAAVFDVMSLAVFAMVAVGIVGVFGLFFLAGARAFRA